MRSFLLCGKKTWRTNRQTEQLLTGKKHDGQTTWLSRITIGGVHRVPYNKISGNLHLFLWKLLYNTATIFLRFVLSVFDYELASFYNIFV